MKPRVGFLGLGWIGYSRLRVLADAGLVDVVAVADTRLESTERVASELPHVHVCASLDELLREHIDGVVIATPSALHASQTIACLNRGVTVFCQKPLARSADEATQVLDAAQRADRRLGVDMSYRYTDAHRALKRVHDDGRLGAVHTADFVFHNAYGPDQSWYYDRALAGGGCLFDLGVHLIDQLGWMLGWTRPAIVDVRLRQQGRSWNPTVDGVEDFAQVLLEDVSGAVARVTCSWRAPAGCDARISVELLGTDGGARLFNVDGSFYDFQAEEWHGTNTSVLAQPPDAWGGRAILEWALAIRESPRYDAAIEQQLGVSRVLDQIYAWRPARLPAMAV